MVRPNPVPPYLRVVELSSCSKARKIVSCFSGGMPMPVSRHREPQDDLALGRSVVGDLHPHHHLAAVR